MASLVEIDLCNLIPLSVTSLCGCPCRPLSNKTLSLPRRTPRIKLNLVLHGSQSVFLVRPNRIYINRRFITAVARTEPESIDESNVEEEVDNGHILPTVNDSLSEQQHKSSQLRKRVVFGLGIGISVGGAVLAGEWFFTAAMAAAVFHGAREYFELVRSRGITAGMMPPPRYISRVCSVICALMPVLTLYFGNIDIWVTSAAFFVSMALLLQRGNPRFAQLSSAMFGLFYCGYLPCFWVKLRCALAAPALNTKIGAGWPFLLGGQAHWTVGLVATLISLSSIIAADTYAFLAGKAIGRTPLTNISPKKTWEGAIVGLGGCIATSVVLSRVFSWPSSWLRLKTSALSSAHEFPPNAFRRKSDSQWRGGFSLGIDLGSSRTGLAVSKGFSVRPLTVLKLRGQKLELQLLDLAEKEEADEFIIGLPKSWDGKETPQSNKVRSIAGRLAVRAAERGWRVYLQDEHGTSTEASNRMINLGLSKSTRQKNSDAYAAVILLERYFAMSGKDTEIVLPKQMDLQEKLRRGVPLDIDFSPEKFDS